MLLLLALEMISTGFSCFEHWDLVEVLMDPKPVFLKVMQVPQISEVHWRIYQSDLLPCYISCQSHIPLTFRNIMRETLAQDVTVVEHPTDQAQDLHQACECQLLEHHGGDAHPV